MPPILLKPADAARALGIGLRTLEDKTSSGEIPAVNIGQGEKRKTLRYLPEDLLAWAKARRISNAEK
jgi:excisionase family DNA binding protein